MNPSWMYVVIGASTLLVANNLISVTCGQILKCPDGWYGINCELICSANCALHLPSTKNNNDGPCNKTTGHCAEGCKPGYHGNTCNMTCAEHCKICVQKKRKCIKCDKGYMLKDRLCAIEIGTKYVRNSTSCKNCSQDDIGLWTLVLVCLVCVGVSTLLIVKCICIVRRERKHNNPRPLNQQEEQEEESDV